MRTLSAKKLLAVGALAFLAANSVYAAIEQIGTGTITGGNISSVDYDTTLKIATGTLTPVTVSATVAPTLDFTISSGAIDLGVLSASAINTASINIGGSTNAFGGMKVSVSSSTGGLASPEHLIAYATPSVGAEGYNLVIGNNLGGANINAAAVTTATNTQIISTAGPVANATADVTFNASISNVTPAGSYQVAHTFTVTGSF